MASRFPVSEPAPERWRQRQRYSGAQGVQVICAGARLINFCSNDYLALASDPDLRDSLIRAAEHSGVGAAASQYICGYHDAHFELEQAVIRYTGQQRALCFSSGYLANLAVQSALLGRGDRVFIDRLAHASSYDAAILSRARLHRYVHADTDSLSRLLDSNPAQRRMIVTDGVFSMDGDIAPLAGLHDLARGHHALLVVDDAHGLGVVGKDGAGSGSACGLQPADIDLHMGTLGKACGVFGAFVAGPARLIDHLEQTARPLIYTTALPPALATAAATGLEKARLEHWRREKLQALIERFRTGAGQLSLPLLASDTPIQPLLLHDDRRAVLASRALQEAGFLIAAIRPPTVPNGSARLRISLSAAHSEAQIDRLLETLSTLCKTA
ncbi:MAG: 8-amino-7-oxononanoate synthase [Thiotrichales bacterium]|nr:8-amino-7-oxononanoate synthase [Thiotrichales bacterium]